MKKQILTLFALVTVTIAMISCDTHELVEPGRLVPLTVDEDPSLPSITVNNTMLHSETFGNPADPLMVVLHGGPGADYRSILNCKEFANDGFFVAFYDQRGSGLSQRHDESIYNTQLMIDDLDAVIEHYQSQDQKLFLVGHSWGAILATGYINQYPNKVDGVILMEPGGLIWKDTEDYVTRAYPLELFGESTNDHVYQDQVITGSDHNTLDYKAGLATAVDFADGNKVGNAGPFPFWRFGAQCSTGLIDYVMDNPFDFTTSLNEFEPKVLFVYSELNEAYGLSHAELVSDPFLEVELVEVLGTGHEIPYPGWDNFYPVAQSYLNSIK